MKSFFQFEKFMTMVRKSETKKRKVTKSETKVNSEVQIDLQLFKLLSLMINNVSLN